MNYRKIMWQWGGAPEQVRRYQQQIKAFRDRQDEYRDISAVNYDGGPKSTAISDPTGKKAMKILELMDLYEETIRQTTVLLNKTCRLMTEVDRILEELPPLQRKIAYLRYRDGKTWVYITMRLNISDAWARRLDGMICRTVTEEIEKCSDLYRQDMV